MESTCSRLFFAYKIRRASAMAVSDQGLGALGIAKNLAKFPPKSAMPTNSNSISEHKAQAQAASFEISL